MTARIKVVDSFRDAVVTGVTFVSSFPPRPRSRQLIGRSFFVYAQSPAKASLAYRDSFEWLHLIEQSESQHGADQ